jgi:hypothetical protein
VCVLRLWQVVAAIVTARRCIGDQVGTKRRPPVIVAYVPYAFVEGPQGVRIPKFLAQQQPETQQQQQQQPQSAASADSDDECAPPAAAREDWLVVLARAAQDKKEWVRRPGK